MIIKFNIIVAFVAKSNTYTYNLISIRIYGPKCGLETNCLYKTVLSIVLTTILLSHILDICLQCLAKYQESRCICILVSARFLSFYSAGGSKLVRYLANIDVGIYFVNRSN